MRRTVGIAAGIIGAAAIGLVAVSCGTDTTAPTAKVYVADLSPANEVPTPFTTPGTGFATIVDNGDHFNWTLQLSNMTGVTLSHIHLGDATVAGPVIINLFIPNTATGTVTGIVGEGTITNANNANVSLDSLRTLFNNGHAYVNVHTTAHGAGEIRGQVGPQ
jgi:hypothetical protein